MSAIVKHFIASDEYNFTSIFLNTIYACTIYATVQSSQTRAEQYCNTNLKLTPISL
jgi:hypothetical protein